MNLNRADAARCIDVLFDPTDGLIAQALRNGGKLQISGFGTFQTRMRRGRIARNPRTGEEIRIEPAITTSFRAGKAFKEAISNSP
jgi:DNA-binding protein HU-beta